MNAAGAGKADAHGLIKAKLRLSQAYALYRSLYKFAKILPALFRMSLADRFLEIFFNIDL